MADEREPVQEAAAAEAAAEPKSERRSDERIAALEARVAELEAALEQQTQEAEAHEREAKEFLDGWQRERASFENFRKRTARELSDAGNVAKVDLLRVILPTVDNLERALDDTSTSADVVREGIRLIHEQLLSALQKQGLKEVPTTGETFDPNVHEAIDSVENTEYEPDTVVEPILKGYTFGERLVRPARVRVAR
ncbi:MAG TPA: nucleotide exchange factor GrpE [Armatimonadetes bacterium]|nr:nucleotide exchange factor GrpE [Armatimonadota bacterium]